MSKTHIRYNESAICGAGKGSLCGQLNIVFASVAKTATCGNCQRILATTLRDENPREL